MFHYLLQSTEYIITSFKTPPFIHLTISRIEAPQPHLILKMASSATESSPLLSPPTTATNSHPQPPPIPSPPRQQRTVTFNPKTTISHPNSAVPSTSHLRPAPFSNPTFPPPQPGQPVLSSLNSKLRRRNSHGSPLAGPPLVQPAPKIGPQRTTKNAQKLKLLPNPDPGDDGPDEESGRDVYSQFTRIKDPTARRDAARLGKADRDRLPRVTAYCTASAYRLEGLMKFLKGRTRTRGANPKQFDECIYSPYNYEIPKASMNHIPQSIYNTSADTNESLRVPKDRERRYSDSAIEVDEGRQQRIEDLIDLHHDEDNNAIESGESSEINPSPAEHERPQSPDLDTQVHTPEVFLFNYGTVVIWGMTLQHEERFLKDIAKFESEKLSEDDVQTENFNFYYTRDYQARIYNDFISLREKKNYMTKLAISHALAQSVKVFPSNQSPLTVEYLTCHAPLRPPSLKILYLRRYLLPAPFRNRSRSPDPLHSPVGKLPCR